MLNFANLPTLPLKDMDGTLLSMTLLTSLRDRGIDTTKVEEAIYLASYLHRNDTRGARAKLPKDNYITHPLRVALRIVRLFHPDTFTNEELVNVVIAAILHDTVEDHASEIINIAFGNDYVYVDAEREQRDALTVVGAYFNTEVEAMVKGVTNAPKKPGKKLNQEEKRADYLTALTLKMENSNKGVFAIKFSDLFDNAGSLHHNMSGDALNHLLLKYQPTIPVMRERLTSGGLTGRYYFSEIDKLVIGRQLDKLEQRLNS